MKDGFQGWCKECSKHKKQQAQARWKDKKPDRSGTKECSKCNNILPKDDFYEDKSVLSGLTSWCIGCLGEHSRENIKKNKFKNQTVDRDGTKQCCTCKETFSKTEFGLSRSFCDGLQSSCKKCCNEENRKYRQEYKQKNLTIDLSGTKKCPKCKRVLKRVEFSKSRHNASGVHSSCKDCCKERTRNIKKKWTEEAPNRDGVKKCRDCKNILSKTLFSISRCAVDGLQSICKKCGCIKSVEYKKNRCIYDPSYKLRHTVSNAVRKSLHKKNLTKNNASVWEFLPYSLLELREHLEALFDQNMSWENYGSYWHIDHIYPQHLLVYDSMEDPNFQKCWALENLRPLEANENLSRTYEEFYGDLAISEDEEK